MNTDAVTHHRIATVIHDSLCEAVISGDAAMVHYLLFVHVMGLGEGGVGAGAAEGESSSGGGGDIIMRRGRGGYAFLEARDGGVRDETALTALDESIAAFEVRVRSAEVLPAGDWAAEEEKEKGDASAGSEHSSTTTLPVPASLIRFPSYSPMFLAAERGHMHIVFLLFAAGCAIDGVPMRCGAGRRGSSSRNGDVAAADAFLVATRNAATAFKSDAMRTHYIHPNSSSSSASPLTRAVADHARQRQRREWVRAWHYDTRHTPLHYAARLADPSVPTSVSLWRSRELAASASNAVLYSSATRSIAAVGAATESAGRLCPSLPSFQQGPAAATSHALHYPHLSAGAAALVAITQVLLLCGAVADAQASSGDTALSLVVASARKDASPDGAHGPRSTAVMAVARTLLQMDWSPATIAVFDPLVTQQQQHADLPTAADLAGEECAFPFAAAPASMTMPIGGGGTSSPIIKAIGLCAHNVVRTFLENGLSVSDLTSGTDTPQCTRTHYATPRMSYTAGLRHSILFHCYSNSSVGSPPFLVLRDLLDNGYDVMQLAEDLCIYTELAAAVEEEDARCGRKGAPPPPPLFTSATPSPSFSSGLPNRSLMPVARFLLAECGTDAWRCIAEVPDDVVLPTMFGGGGGGGGGESEGGGGEGGGVIDVFGLLGGV